MHKLVEDTVLEAATGDSLLAEAAQLQALPGFPRAVGEYSVGLAQFRQGPRLINKMIAYEARFRVVGYLLYLHADRERFGPQGGASYGRLLELCTRRQEVSPRVLKTVLALLKLSGFIDTLPGGSDRRLKLYAPTARMLEFVRGWVGYTAAALDAVQPDLHRVAALRDDPEFIRRFLVSGGRGHIDEVPPADHMPEFVAFFGGREGASGVVPTVMLAAIEGTPLLSRAAIAKRFGLSKTQVGNVVAEGVRLGFLTLDSSSVPIPTQHLRDSYFRWISIELAFLARHMRPA